MTQKNKRMKAPFVDTLCPDWSAPAHVKAYSTCRHQGFSLVPFDSCNPALHTGDNVNAVQQNRQLIREQLQLPTEPAWLDQVHGTDIIQLREDAPDLQMASADGSYTTNKNQVCVVMTADCLPLLITNRQGSEVAAVHAGWRGLCQGVIESAIQKFSSPVDELLVWLGPAIGPGAFEVGEEVRQAFIHHDSQAEVAFKASGKRWMADIYQLARQRLAVCGVNEVTGGGFCTYTDQERFYSYRREGQTGRMASLIWMSE